jgi:hypothetical protein
MPVIYVPHQQKMFAKYRCRTYNRWQVAFNHVVRSNDVTYANVVSIPTEEHNRYMTYITTYPPSGARAFYVARIALDTLRKCIHVLRKRPQDIPRSPRPSCTVVTNRTTDTQPLPHNTDCPQANLVLRGRVRDSHHLTGGYLPPYLFVGALLQKSKLSKVSTESKSLLACHLLRLL